jgi:hypothetical protein
VTEDGVMFKIGGEEVMFNQAFADTSNTTTVREEIVTIEYMVKRSEPILHSKDQPPSIPEENSSEFLVVAVCSEVQTVATKSNTSQIAWQYAPSFQLWHQNPRSLLRPACF